MVPLSDCCFDGDHGLCDGTTGSNYLDGRPEVCGCSCHPADRLSEDEVPAVCVHTDGTEHVLERGSDGLYGCSRDALARAEQALADAKANQPRIDALTSSIRSLALEITPEQAADMLFGHRHLTPQES